MTFDSCSSLKVDNLKFKNSQKMHVSFDGCTNVQVSNLVISAPESSPNTDGIHVTSTTNIWINNCVIQTGITILLWFKIIVRPNLIMSLELEKLVRTDQEKLKIEHLQPLKKK